MFVLVDVNYVGKSYFGRQSEANVSSLSCSVAFIGVVPGTVCGYFEALLFSAGGFAE